MAFLALNVWTGSPLLAVWLGSQIQGEESQPSMGAYAAVIGCLILFSWGLYQLLKVTMARVPGGHRHDAHRADARSLASQHARGAGRPPPAAARISGAEKIVVVTC